MQPENRLSTNLAQKKLDPISPFEKDADFVFVFKKTEKLASAIYMVTNLFSESEPMKWTLRKKISELVSFMVNYKDTEEATRTAMVNSMKTKILELVSLLEISHHGGLISLMNFSILKQEFNNLGEALLTEKDAPKDIFGASISKDFFEIQQVQKTHSETMKTFPIHNFSNEEVLYKRTQTEDVKDKSLIPSKDEQKRTNRQTTILNLIKKKKELTIKDLAEVITDCSEKTIQRELNSFISAGILKRSGVRRWSKYSLA